MEKENNVKKTNKEEPKFTKVDSKDLKKEKGKEKEMNSIDNKKSAKSKKSKSTTQPKNNKVGYWVGGVVLILVVLAIVTALILLPATPDKTIEGMLNCLKNGDLENINKYVDYNQIVNQSEMLGNSEGDQELQTLLFSQLSWKNLNITKEEEKATAEIEITNKDFEKVISNYTEEALKIAFSGQSFTEEEQMNKLKEQLKNEEIGTKTVTTTVQMIKQDGKWKVQVDDNLINALLPGLQDAINSLNSIING